MNQDNAAKIYENEESLYVASIVWVGPENYQQIFEKSIFDDLIELEFEGRKFFAPKNYDTVLSAIYGDYMTPPPIDKRNSHNFKAYLR